MFAGIEYLHVDKDIAGQFGHEYAMIKDAVVISEFNYEGHPPPTKRGIVLPFDSGK